MKLLGLSMKSTLGGGFKDFIVFTPACQQEHQFIQFMVHRFTSNITIT